METLSKLLIQYVYRKNNSVSFDLKIKVNLGHSHEILVFEQIVKINFRNEIAHQKQILRQIISGPGNTVITAPTHLKREGES